MPFCRIEQTTYFNLPIYYRGGQSVNALYISYAKSFKIIIRLNEFQNAVKSLTKRGESKGGLSTYYIIIRNLIIFEEMLQRLPKMPYNSHDKSTLIKWKFKGLNSLWKEMYLFLSYEYSFNHLQQHLYVIISYATYEAGGECSHKHWSTVC